MASYPTLSSGSSTLTRSSRIPVRILQSVDGTEQRFRAAKQLEAYTLNHSGISKADVAAIRTMFEGRKGSYDVFDFTFGGTTYYNLSFDSDEFHAVESTLGRYDVTLSFRQRK